MKINDPKLINKIQQVYKVSDVSKIADKTSLPKQGELIEGEILDLKQSLVTIKLSNGQTFEAKMTEVFEFFIGQKLPFLVKESSVEQLLLKPLSNQREIVQDKLIYILENAGFTASKSNLQLVNKLIEQQLPIDQETLQKIIPLTKQFSQVDIDKILFLYKNKIPITKENIKQFEDILQGRNKLIQSLATLSDKLSLILDDNMGQEIIQTLLKNDNISLEAFNQIKEQVQVQTQTQIQTQTQTQIQYSTETANNKAEIKENIPINTILPKNEVIKLESELNQILKKADIKTSEGTSAGIINKEGLDLENKTLQEIFKTLKSFEQLPELKKILTSKIAGRVTYSLINKAIVMNQVHLENPNRVKAFYEQLNEKIISLLTKNDGINNDKIKHLSKEMHQIKNNIEFMDALSQKYNYIQLPMILNDKLLNGDLYVFNNKQQVKKEKSTITALLRLEFVNLGHLDIYINKEQKNLSIQFFTEDETKNKMIEERLYTLHNQLRKMGFKVQSISTKKKEKDFQVMEDFLDKKEIVHEIKRYTFDMRA